VAAPLPPEPAEAVVVFRLRRESELLTPKKPAGRSGNSSIREPLNPYRFRKKARQIGGLYFVTPTFLPNSFLRSRNLNIPLGTTFL
jgi:hypothetical protein